MAAWRWKRNAAYRRARGLPADALMVLAQEHLERLCTDAGIEAGARQRWFDEGAALDASTCIALALSDDA